MRAIGRLLPALPLLAALGGCETTPSAAGGSCTADPGLCLNLIAVDENLVAQALCLEIVGPAYAFHLDQACPAEGVVGTCSRTDPGVVYAIVYFDPTYTTGTATADCATRGGAFQPP